MRTSPGMWLPQFLARATLTHVFVYHSAFYKHMLGLKPTFADFESASQQYYKTMKKFLKSSVGDLGMAVWPMDGNHQQRIDPFLLLCMHAETGLTFQLGHDYLGKYVTVDLKPNGGDIPLTDENKVSAC